MSTARKAIDAALLALEVLAIIRAVTDAANDVISRARDEGRDVTEDDLNQLKEARRAALAAFAEKLGK